MSTQPGATALTLTPRSAHSTARLLVRFDTAAFVAAYAARAGQAVPAAMELVLTIAPPRSPMARANAWQQ